jgi:hypothetical protein
VSVHLMENEGKEEEEGRKLKKIVDPESARMQRE